MVVGAQNSAHELKHSTSRAPTVLCDHCVVAGECCALLDGSDCPCILNAQDMSCNTLTICRLLRLLGVKEVTDGADLLLQLLEQLLQQLTGQRIRRQEPGDPEGALVMRQVSCHVFSVSPVQSCNHPVGCCQIASLLGFSYAFQALRL